MLVFFISDYDSECLFWKGGAKYDWWARKAAMSIARRIPESFKYIYIRLYYLDLLNRLQNC